MRRLNEFALGVVLGLIVGLFVVELGTLVLLPIAFVVVAGVWTRVRPWFAGALVGAGGLWLAISVVATIQCSQPDLACGSSPNLLPLTLLGLTTAVSGMFASVGAFRRHTDA